MSKTPETLGDVKLSVDETTLEQLAHEFNLAVTEILGSEGSDRIRQEYEKLYRALKKSRDAEKKLMNKCRDLHAELMKNTSKVATMADDANQIASLQKENKRAWDIIDEMKRKDLDNGDKLLAARAEIAKLTKVLEKTGAIDIDTSRYSFKDLIKIKDDLEKRLAEQIDLVAQAQQKVDDVIEGSKHFEEERQELNGKMLELSYEINGQQAELQREGRRRERLEADLRKTRTEADEKGEEVRKLSIELEKAKHDMQHTETQLKEVKIAADRSQKEVDITQEQLTKAHEEYEKVSLRATSLNNDLQDLKQVAKTQEDELTFVKMELTKATRQRDTLQRKVRQMEDAKREVEEQRDMYQNQMVTLEKKCESLNKQVDADTKALNQTTRERDMLDVNCRRAATEVQKQTNLAKQGEQTIHNLDTEIGTYRAEAQKQRQIIYQLEKDRDRYINEAAELTQKVLKHIEEVKIREAEIFDLKKKSAEIETRLKQQQNLYEAVRSDRNLYSKNLMESQDEVTEMRRKLSVTNHTVEQLREEVNTQEQNMVKERLEKQNVLSERDMMNTELGKMRLQMAEVKEYIARQQQESTRLLKIIRESDAMATLQKKQLEAVTAERDILGSQLIRRNDELTLLYEKIKIQQAVLDKGERGYHQRIEDIRILKLQIRQMRRELTKAKAVAAESYEMRQEYFHLQREVLREKAKCKALEEELARPLNIHRWRRLEGSDPSTFELIKKTQHLQQRLLRKVAMLARTHNAIQEKDRLYLELKRIIARQPGFEVVEKIASYQATLKTRTRQMQAMASELNMYENKETESRYEISRVTEELANVKKRYFVEKKKNMATADAFNILKHSERQRQITNASISIRATRPPHNRGRLPAILPRPPLERVIGGGFNWRKPAKLSSTIKTATTPDLESNNNLFSQTLSGDQALSSATK